MIGEFLIALGLVAIFLLSGVYWTRIALNDKDMLGLILAIAYWILVAGVTCIVYEI